MGSATGRQEEVAADPDRCLVSQAKDAGGSMTIHMFGAYFGLVVTWILYRPNLDQCKERQRPVYHSNLFAMIGESHHGGQAGSP